MPDIYAEKMVRNEAEARRLDEQFDILTKNIGYLIHPRIPPCLPNNPLVADVGTGTGHFLQCLHDSHLCADPVLHGYDISPAMFPCSPPSYMSLSHIDIKQTPAPELRDKFDLVHARMLIPGMLPSDWPSVVANAAQMLKPGAWLQWVECDMVATRYLRAGVDSRVETARRLSRTFCSAFQEQFEHGWSNLPDDMRAAGLTNIVCDCVSTDRLPETRKALAMNGMKVIVTWMGKAGLLQDDDEKKAFEDIESGCYCRFDVHVICGQKPL